jgi:hypothetical protein
VKLATVVYNDRDPSTGLLDPVRLAILADAPLSSAARPLRLIPTANIRQSVWHRASLNGHHPTTRAVPGEWARRAESVVGIPGRGVPTGRRGVGF